MIYPINYITITCGFHQGKSLDFGYWGHPYQDVYSCAKGKVIKRETQKTGGNTLFIQHEDGSVSCYGHLNEMVVKKGQVVAMGQKIGTMGATGQVSGMHLHFGIYSKKLADRGFVRKGLYGKSDIDPFEVCYVYCNQVVNQNQSKSILRKFKYYEDKNKWTAGDYVLLFDKAVRKSHNLGLNIAKVGDLRPATRKYLTSQRLNDNAKLKEGTECKINSIYNENGRIWGAFGQFWIVLCNIDGKPQSKKI